jgi:hypothetical protein
MENISSTQLDFIGDIHGHADELIELLEKMGYSEANGVFNHPTRKAFFCGDFIDRGPQIKEVLQLVKAMIDNGAAYTVIGNHEYNSICFHTLVNGKPLRPHIPHNVHQHQKTLDALSPDELQAYVEWFKTLPIWIDNENFGVVHAQWEKNYVQQLRERGLNDFSDEQFLIASATKNSSEHKIIECLLKGKEIPIANVYFHDKDGKQRNAYRLKWWKKGLLKCNEALFEFPEDNDSMLHFPLEGIEKGFPVFFGHYWLKDEKPVIQSANACCLDFSVAKGGLLAAYRWEGEKELTEENFYWVESRKKDPVK